MVSLHPLTRLSLLQTLEEARDLTFPWEPPTSSILGVQPRTQRENSPSSQISMNSRESPVCESDHSSPRDSAWCLQKKYEKIQDHKPEASSWSPSSSARAQKTNTLLRITFCTLSITCKQGSQESPSWHHRRDSMSRTRNTASLGNTARRKEGMRKVPPAPPASLHLATNTQRSESPILVSV